MLLHLCVQGKTSRQSLWVKVTCATRHPVSRLWPSGHSREHFLEETASPMALERLGGIERTLGALRQDSQDHRLQTREEWAWTRL